MSFLVLRAYLKLIGFESCLRRHNFSVLYDKVRNCPLSTRVSAPDDVKRICAAVDVACIWYWRQALCLQRSAAATCLLRRYGTNAQLVIGSRLMPFQAHAWVEVEGRVVNDRPHVKETYAVLDRC